MLAEFDSRSYHRSLIRDANNIMQRILQPMSLPWTHKVVPVARNIPCDIDEMIDILTADDGSHTPFINGNFGFGQFETGRLRSGESAIRLANSSENFRAAARRSTEPGVIQLSTTVLPSTLPSYHPEDLSAIRSPPPTSVDECHYDDRSIEGETALRCFVAMQALKKQKIEQARSCVASYEISVKVNSSSSRSSIFSSSLDRLKLSCDTVPSENPESAPSESLEATLPIEVEGGRKMSKTKAKIEAEKLGSYDIRHGVTNSQSCKSAKTQVGRTRLVWSCKTGPDQNQRVSFTSLVTGKKLENGAQKRPRNIRVRIKVDGKICSAKNVGKDEQIHSTNKACHSATNLQASLECDQLVRSLFDRKPDKIKRSNFLPPTIECIADSAGGIHVVCTSPGSIPSSSINQLLTLAAQRPVPCCTVCWRSAEGGREVEICAGCGLLVHTQCCLDPGESRLVSIPSDPGRTKEWKCNVCCYRDKNQRQTHEANDESQNTTTIKKSKRKSRLPNKFKDPEFESMQSEEVGYSRQFRDEFQCHICLLSGGAMSRVCVEGEELWAHEVCRIWTESEGKSSRSIQNQCCAICGGTNRDPQSCFDSRKDEQTGQKTRKTHSSRCLVRCAAVGCHISVHPMCALASSLMTQTSIDASSKCGSKPLDQIAKAKKRDRELCSQHTLTFASVRGKNSAGNFETIIPVFFCGIHNPAREKSFYGFYPGGSMMDVEKVLKIPS
eukprot:jgi/Psemu1/246401/estExt_Genewise1.C_7780013